MPNERNKSEGPYSERINVNEYFELKGWAEKFGVDDQTLRDAVREVGNNADDVEAYLSRF
jgi:hypothetical protein